MTIQPFTIHVAQRTLDDLRERLAQTRWPDEIGGAGWDYGTNLEYLKALAAYWYHQFDWRSFVRTSMASAFISSTNAARGRTRYHFFSPMVGLARSLRWLCCKKKADLLE